jgi:hypothetical protein
VWKFSKISRQTRMASTADFLFLIIATEVMAASVQRIFDLRISEF